MASACSGLKVLEIAQGMAGALAGMVLADHGADVVKVESPAGDPFCTEAGSRLWNRGKQRIALDLGDPRARQSVLRLAARADVVLLAMRPSTAEALGLDYRGLSRENPGLVFATVTGFGWSSPRRDEFAVDGMVHAMSGSMMSTQGGGFREGPIYVAPRIASYAAAMLSVQGTLAALHVRQSTGLGQHVDTSLLQGALCYRGIGLVKAERHQEEIQTQPAIRDARGIRPLFNLNECADGRWLSMAAFTRAFCETALEVMGLSHLLQDPRFQGLPNTFPTNDDRMALLNILWDAFKKAPLQEWIDRLWKASVPCEPVLNVDEFRRHEQLWANHLAVTVQDPVVGPMVQPGLLGALAATPGEIRPAQARAEGMEATDGIARRWGRAAASPAAGGGGANGAFARGPLTGVKVLDFTAFVAGPMCTRLLADFGADVIKVESLEGDWFRISSKGAYAVLNRGKRDISLDLKAPGTREVLERLVRDADVVVYNYRLGVEDRLGLDYESLRRGNPDLILCRMTAFGPEGPQARRPAYETSLSALSGNYMEQAGQGNPPAAFGAADISSGVAAAATVQLALRARDVTGKGQLVEATMIGTMAYVAADGFPDYPGKPPRPRVDSNQQGISPTYRLYRTSDGWAFLSAALPRQRQALLSAMGLPQTQPADFATLEAAFKGRTTAEWVSLLRPLGVPCVDPVVEMERFMLEDPEMARSRMVVRLPHPRYGSLTEPGAPVHLSSTPCVVERAEPLLGQHTEEVLLAAGTPPEVVRELLGRGAIAVAAGG